ncbi:MAG: hypothetical protein P3W84_000215, partial [Thermodesulfobacteriaceae bacterium]|nr:hypothetical protein [Thermodesulfobacteriaceae bacterium]
MYLVEVVLPISIDKKFHYVSSIYIEPGTRVIVPFGRQKTVGMAYSICEISPQLLSPNLEYKSIEDILDDFPLYPKELFSFLEWVSHYYLCPLGILFKIALPTGTFKVPSRKIILTEKGRKALKEGVLPPA